jgi:hypothetical protein
LNPGEQVVGELGGPPLVEQAHDGYEEHAAHLEDGECHLPDGGYEGLGCVVEHVDVLLADPGGDLVGVDVGPEHLAEDVDRLRERVQVQV